jgi:HD-GYP domain-containing protein (c-di-GMP phosphodiesterase class II)/DNA-binding CsgD family transcriptional regulator
VPKDVVSAPSATVDISTLTSLVADGERASSSIAAIADGVEGALRARAPAHHAGTPLVRKLAFQVARRLGLDATERQVVDVCAQVRDAGMISLPDSVVLKTGPLSPADWALLNRHPELGAELLESFPAMRRAAELVRAHHERWDGEGYPDGLEGELVPLPSRIVSVCDAFVAIATDRPHRSGIGAGGALEYILEERDAQFDPLTVDCLVEVIRGKSRSRATPNSGLPGSGPLGAGQPTAGLSSAGPTSPFARRAPAGALELRRAIAEFDTVPAFEPAVERTLAATEFGGPLVGDLAGAIESDIGATVAILRAAQRRSDARVVGVPDALALLTAGEVRDAIGALPAVAFPWRTKFEALLLRCQSHAQAVARATDRIALLLRPSSRDELVAAALLHDVGKLLLALVSPDFADGTNLRDTPEEALRRERREFGFDHATLGGLLAERWGLSDGVVRGVSGHHSAHGAPEAALIRLADMVVHHAQGDAVDRDLMLRLATRCELSTNALRAIVVDLPHAGGNARRRAEPSPLSRRETAILRLLAEGRRGTAIAQELHLSESTVRTHLHNIYAKLEVPDRTQAVLRATDMGWI